MLDEMDRQGLPGHLQGGSSAPRAADFFRFRCVGEGGGFLVHDTIEMIGSLDTDEQAMAWLQNLHDFQECFPPLGVVVLGWSLSRRGHDPLNEVVVADIAPEDLMIRCAGGK